MAMTMRERILAVYRGETPDVVPYMLDLSHWFYHKNRQPWDLTTVYEQPETGLIDYHKRAGVGFYMPNLAAFTSTAYKDDVRASVSKGTRNGVPEITWRLETPLGAIERRRVASHAIIAHRERSPVRREGGVGQRDGRSAEAIEVLKLNGGRGCVVHDETAAIPAEHAAEAETLALLATLRPLLVGGVDEAALYGGNLVSGFLHALSAEHRPAAPGGGQGVGSANGRA